MTDKESADTTIRVTGTIARRLQRRRRADESAYYEVIDRLLQETTTTVDLETVRHEIYEYCDEDIAAITLTLLPTIGNPQQARIVAFTGSADSLEDYPDELNDPATKLSLSLDGAHFELDLEVMLTVDGPPGSDIGDSVVLYRSDTVLGAEPRSWDDGVAVVNTIHADQSDS